MLQGSPMRLLRAQLREAERSRRHPVAMHRGRARRHRAPLLGWPVLHGARHLRGVRARSEHRQLLHRDGIPRAQPGPAGDPQACRVDDAAGSARRGTPSPTEHRPDGLPLPHADEDGPGAGARGGSARCLGGACTGRRRAPRHRGRGVVRRRLLFRLAPCTRATDRRPRRQRLRSIPLRLLGLGHRGRARGERVDRDDLGSGLEAAAVQEPHAGPRNQDRRRRRSSPAPPIGASTPA